MSKDEQDEGVDAGWKDGRKTPVFDEMGIVD